MSEKSRDLTKRIEGIVTELAGKVDSAAASEAVRAYLDTAARFHRYSFGNTILIALQCPHASHVAGYRKWNEFNRYVRKGEKGIAILAPCMPKGTGKVVTVTDDDGEERQVRVSSQPRGFRLVYVFDVSQTDGEELPTWEELCAAHGEAPALEALEAAARAHVPVTSADAFELDGAKGDTDGQRIRLLDTLEPADRFQVLAHELAHVLFEHSKKHAEIARSDRELEAETVAYIVTRYFGIEPSGDAYLALWRKEAKDVLAAMERATRIADQIISETEGAAAPVAAAA